MESFMKISVDTHHALARINAALIKGDDAALEKAFDGVELQEILSQDTVAAVRALGKAPLTMLLCTLAEHNDVEVERARHWLACYQSIAQKQLAPSLVQLPGPQVLRLAVVALTHRQPLTTEQLKKMKPKGSPLVWQDAVELLLDHKDWSSLLALLTHLGRQPSETKIWLQISRCLSRRHRLYVDETGVPQADVDYRALARLYGLCADAAQNAKVVKVQRALNHLAASALEIAGEHVTAISRLNKLDPHAKSVAVQLDIARNHCKAGDAIQSMAILDLALRLYAVTKNTEEQVSTELLGAGSTEFDVPEKSFDVKKASRALSDLSSMANEKGTPVFLVSGTLLGYVREGQLLSHDKDIDVGIVGWENQYALCMALQESGLFTVSAQFLKGPDTFYIPIKHNATGMWIDVFVYHPKDDKWVTGVDFFFGYRQTFAFTPFELQDIEFLGVTMKAPVRPEINLTENYGNWRVPDVAYLSHLESPSTMDKGGLSYMLTARLQALAACIKNKPAKLKKILTLMREHQAAEGAMSQELIDILSQSLSSTDAHSEESCHA